MPPSYISVRIWNLKTNQQVGDPLLHDDQLFTVVLSSDGRYIASAGLDQKFCIWSLEAALEQAGDRVRVHIAIKQSLSRYVCIVLSFVVSDPDTNERAGNDIPRQRNLFDFLLFSPRHAMPPNATQVGSTVFHWSNLTSPLIPFHFYIFVVSTHTRSYRPIIYHHFLRHHTMHIHVVKVVAHSCTSCIATCCRCSPHAG